MKNIKIFCSWDLHFDLHHEKQIELYVDVIPSGLIPTDTIRIVFLLEPVDILNLNQSAIDGYNNGCYNFILTHNEELLNAIPSAHLFEFGTTWVKHYDFPDKECNISTLVGGKLMAPGHHLRQKVWFKESRIKSIPTKFFLSGNFGGIENYNNNPVLGQDKSPLFKSQFHICIENTKRKNWFTEKLIDCLQTKTIPIYWGCPNIGDWFNTQGFYIVDTLEDVIAACNSINENSYNEKLEFVEENFEKSKKFATINDRLEAKIQELLNQDEFDRWLSDQGDASLRLNYDLDDKSVVFDLGGYKGDWAAAILHRYKSNIYIFEPVKDFYAGINKKFIGNPKIHMFEYGLGNKEETLSISLTTDSSSVFNVEGVKETIQLKSLVDFIRTNEIEHVDLMKINIEGGEYDLLEDVLLHDQAGVFNDIQVQFHRFIPNCIERRNAIREGLSKTHELTYDYEFVWENWKLKKQV
jgi:FkbM family methyltransferase